MSKETEENCKGDNVEDMRFKRTDRHTFQTQHLQSNIANEDGTNLAQSNIFDIIPYDNDQTHSITVKRNPEKTEGIQPKGEQILEFYLVKQRNHQDTKCGA